MLSATSMKPTVSLEKDLRKEMRMTAVRRAVLGSVAAVGVISTALIAPNALLMLKPFLKQYERQKKYQTKKAISRLIAGGFLMMEKTSRGSFVVLTKKGKNCVAQWELRGYKVKKPKKWDKKWRVVIFDIPEKRKQLRGEVRTILTGIGFVRLQDSVWIYPYNCEEFVVLLKAELGLGRDVLYLIVDRVEDDRALRIRFKLD